MREIVEWKVENMTDLTPELGLDAIDEWFKIGKKSVQHSLKTVPRSVTRGRYFNIETQRPRVAETEDAFHLQRYVSYTIQIYHAFTNFIERENVYYWFCIF